MHRVYMRFQKEADLSWRVHFVSMDGDRPMRNLQFASHTKIEEMAERSGALRDLASRQGLENGIRNGIGGLMLTLNDDQFNRIAR